MKALEVLSVGPAVAVQDLGRPGWLAHGLTKGGAMDRHAFFEAAALLGQTPDCAGLEMMGAGGSFRANVDIQIALTGAEMDASIDGRPLTWHASHALASGTTLTLGAVRGGMFGYLHVKGGFQTEVLLGARGTHASAGLGEVLKAGDALPLDDSCTGALPSRYLPSSVGSNRRVIRVVAGHQTALFTRETLERFLKTEFRKDARSDRQAIRLGFEGSGFKAQDQRSLVSELIAVGDIQITGDGTPFCLMAETQTTGGYPRIATVLPSDIPSLVQLPFGTPFHFEMLDWDTALEAERKAQAAWRTLGARVEDLTRDPKDIADLAGYQLISGVVSGTEPI